MEINLTEIWETMTSPFRAVGQRVSPRARSRRRPGGSVNFARQYSRSASSAATGTSSGSRTQRTFAGPRFPSSPRFSGSPRSSRKLTPSERRLRLMKILRLFAILSVVGVIVGFIAFFALFAWVAKDLPNPGSIVRKEGFSTKILDRNGKLLYDFYADERRDPVTIDQIPKYLQQATVATEDKTFYTNQGVDPLTPLRIIYNYIFRRGRLVGGSTLTQQLVKNVLLTNERTVMRKFREMVLAIQIQRKFTKAQILEMYLNEAPYGGNASGVGAASEMYFGVPVSQLNLVQCAILAGLPQSPTVYSPLTDKKDTDGTPYWKERAVGVLRRMQEDGYINQQVHDQAVKDLDTVQFASSKSQITAPHFVFYVRDQLEKKFGAEVVAKGGLQVTTTLDLDLQNTAQNTVKTEIDKVKNVNITNGSALVMDPHTGEILAMVGSADYNDASIDGQFNVAVDGLRQPGSSVKPITYLLMLRKGYTPASMLVDAPTVFFHNSPNDKTEKPYQPQNYDGKFHGPLSLRNSLGNSDNINAVKSLSIVGVQTFLQQAFSMGFGTLQPTQENTNRFGLSLTLGGGEVHLIDTVSSYSAFANGGTRVDPISILKVTDPSGNPLYEFHPVEGPRVMSPEEAFLIDSMLSDNSARLIDFGPNSQLNTGKPIAVKTGTTNDKKDNWTIGWSQNFMVGVWVGNNDNSSMKQVASGITGAAPIWRSIVDSMIKGGAQAPAWVQPPNVEQDQVDNISGYPQHDGFPAHQEFVIKGTLPSQTDTIHQNLKVCKGVNPPQLATDAKVASGDFDQKEYITLHEDDPISQDGTNRWQDGINTWIASQSDDRYKPPTTYCGDTGELFVRLNKPNDQTTYPNEDIDVDAESDSNDGIQKMELWVDGNLSETINDHTYKGTIHLSGGRHQVYVKAFSSGGKQAQSGTANIGTGGQNWQAPQATATPTPTPTPTPTATPTPTPTPTVTPSPTPTATPTYTCNSACTTDAQCQTANPLYVCAADQGNKCRLGTNHASATCGP